MSRLSKEQLTVLIKKENVTRLWSWSKVNTFLTSKYEYFLKYIKHIPEDRTDCVYAPLGSICHSALEKYYTNQIKYDDMITDFEDGWTMNIDVLNLKFDRNDEKKNKSISEKYKYNLKHFFKHHKPIEYKTNIEKFASVKIGENLFQGYLDCCFKDENGNVNIIDFKTSTKFSGKIIEEKTGQLVIYAMALIQAGIPIERIKIGFNFLKYCTVEYEQSNGAKKARDIERYKIGDSLKSNAKMWLKKNEYSEKEIESYLNMLIETNDITCLPKEVQNKYVFLDCYVYVPLTQKLMDKWRRDIIATIKDIEAREKDYQQNQNEKIFWDNEEDIKKESYYFSTLCGYSGTIHKPYGEYLQKLKDKENGKENLFDGIGSDAEKDVSNESMSEWYDLSWLDNVL